ncbi:condensation domain-containing protein, partial [Escherichia sp. HC-CC]
ISPMAQLWELASSRYHDAPERALSPWRGHRLDVAQSRESYEAFSNKELSEQRVIPLIQPDIRYIDYVAWQNQQLATGAWEHEKQYWKQALQDVPTLALPLDHVRPRVTSHRGDTFSTKLNKNDVASLKKLAQQEQISLYMLLFTAYTHFLQQISGQQDFVVGT